jgi:hypothetical protein
MIDDGVGDFDAVTLDELTRIDRKYIVTPGALAQALAGLDAPPRVLDIGGQQRFSYESVYFDTSRFESYFGAARRRPHRFKVRTRLYVDSQICNLEVKLKSARGHTVKHRIAHQVADQATLGAAGDNFVRGFEPVHDLASELRPVLTTSYLRSTLLLSSNCRVTIDSDVGFERLGHALGGQSLRLGDYVIVETKSTHGVGDLDRALWAQSLRPASISKYCIGLAALTPDLPANRWHRTLERYLRHGRGGSVSGRTTVGDGRDRLSPRTYPDPPV